MALVHDVEAPLVVVKEPSGYQKARCVSLPGLCRCVSDGNDYRTQIVLERVVRGESRKQGRVTTWLGCYLLIHVDPSFHFVRHRRLAQCLLSWAHVLLPQFFLDGGVMFAFRWFRSCCSSNITRPRCLCWVTVVPALPLFVVCAYDSTFHNVSQPIPNEPLLSPQTGFLNSRLRLVYYSFYPTLFKVPHKVSLLREMHAVVRRSKRYEATAHGLGLWTRPFLAPVYTTIENACR